MDFTILCLPMPFEGKDDIAQRNSIHSWVLLEPKPEIILLGNEKGVREIVQQFGAIHIPDIDRNECGDLSVRSVLEQGYDRASHDIVAYVDADVILFQDFAEAIERVHSDFLLYMTCGYRRTIKVDRRMNFRPDWQDRLWEQVQRKGKQFRQGMGSGSDYFMTPAGFPFPDIPDFSVGAGHWDGWRMWAALQVGAQLVDTTAIIRAIHQEHPWRKWRRGPATERNYEMCDYGERWAWTHDATYVYD